MKAIKFLKARKKTIILLVVAMSLCALSLWAASATSDTTFADLVNKLQDWSKGGLGKTFALAALLVGLGIGIVRQSVMGAATGFGVAAGAYYGPGVLTGVFSAVMGSHATHAAITTLHSLF